MVITDCDTNATGTVVVPQTIEGRSVTSLDSYAFRGCSLMSGIELPFSLTNIGYAAFFECSSLGDITIPAGVVSIGDGAF